MMKKWKYSIILMILSMLLLIPYSAAFAEENDGWKVITNMPEARSGSAIAEVDGVIYVISGSEGAAVYKNVQAYNIATNTWSKKTDIPTARSGAATVVIEGKIYVLGGYTGNWFSWSGGESVKTVEVYDTKSDTWTTKSSLLTAVGAASAISFDNKIYVFGGAASDIRSVASVQVYDPVTDIWSTKKDIPQPIHTTGIVKYNNKIYLVGGRYTGPNVALNYFQEYDPITDSWLSKTNLPENRSALASALVGDKIYAIGGLTPSSETNTAVVYDFKTNLWERIPNLNEARAGASSINYKGKVYVIGGSALTHTNKAVGSIEVFGKEDETENPGPVDPQPETGDRAILVVTMTTGLEKEFDLSMTEVNAYIDWYEAKSNGIGSAKFAIDKHNNNKGPFASRKDYVIFDKILTFEVSEYTTM